MCVRARARACVCVRFGCSFSYSFNVFSVLLWVVMFCIVCLLVSLAIVICSLRFLPASPLPPFPIFLLLPVFRPFLLRLFFHCFSASPVFLPFFFLLLLLGTGRRGKGGMEVGGEGDYIPIPTLSPPE